MRAIIFILILTGIYACKNPTIEIQAELEKAHEEITLLKKQLEEENEDDNQTFLVHTVFFKLKPNLKKEQIENFKKELASLGKIESTDDLEVGIPAETGDKRLVSDYDVVLFMEFENMEGLKKYAVDSFHLEVRKRVGGMLAQAPIVYDYWLD